MNTTKLAIGLFLGTAMALSGQAQASEFMEVCTRDFTSPLVGIGRPPLLLGPATKFCACYARGISEKNQQAYILISDAAHLPANDPRAIEAEARIGSDPDFEETLLKLAGEVVTATEQCDKNVTQP